MPKLTIEDRTQIYSLSKQGKRDLTIANKLRCSVRSVKYWKSRPVPISLQPRKTGGGRKCVFSRPEQKKLEKFLSRHSREGTKSLTPKINEKFGKNVTDRTIRNYVNRFSLTWANPRKKPLLTPEYKKRRLAFAKALIGKIDWDNCVMADETPVNASPPTSGQRVPKGQRPTIETVKHPPKVNVWLGICAKAKIQPFLYQENLTGELLRSIFKSNLAPACNRRMPRKWSLLHDRASEHTSKVIKSWVTENVPDRVILLPSDSPDLNPIENLFAELKRRVALKGPKTQADLEKVTKQVIAKLPRPSILTLCRSMDDRLRACIKAKGGHTKY